MVTLKNPYGLKEGKLITANEAERGLSCNCTCPACGEKLQAHKGTEKQAYFSHYRGADCGYGLETATHIMAKDIIEKEQSIILPQCVVHPNWAELEYIKREYKNIGYFPDNLVKKEIVKPWTKIKLDSVVLEKKIENIVPDVIVKVKGSTLFVEIKVTHGIDEKKLEYIQENNFNVIEYDFSNMGNIINSVHLKNVLTKTYKGAKKGSGRSIWINHKDSTKYTNELTEKLKKLYPPKPPWELLNKT